MNNTVTLDHVYFWAGALHPHWNIKEIHKALPHCTIVISAYLFNFYNHSIGINTSEYGSFNISEATNLNTTLTEDNYHIVTPLT